MDSLAPSRFPTTAADEQSGGTSRQITPERLADAVNALRLAQRRYSRDKAPVEWAMLQNNLGNALARLGERESGSSRIEEAVPPIAARLKSTPVRAIRSNGR